MADDELRRLEREAAHDPVARLKLAHALERAGRPVDALAALVAGADDLECRRAAARFPRGQLPIPSAPRIRWETELPGSDRFTKLLATPLGIVASSRQRTLVLDADTGAVRVELPPGHPLLLDEVVLHLLDDLALTGHDLWTGAPLFHAPSGLPFTPAERLFAFARAGVVAWAGGQVHGWRLSDLRRGPDARWRAPTEGASRVALVTDELVVVTDDRSLRALDARDGGERFRLTGPPFQVHTSGHDLLVVRQVPGAALLDSTGAVRWARRDVSGCSVWSAAGAVGLEHPPGGPPRLVLLDPETGATRAPLHPLAPQLVQPGLLVGQTDGEVWAADHAGRPVWRWRPARGRAVRVQALPGRLLVEVPERRLVCLEG